MKVGERVLLLHMRKYDSYIVCVIQSPSGPNEAVAIRNLTCLALCVSNQECLGKEFCKILLLIM